MSEATYLRFARDLRAAAVAEEVLHVRRSVEEADALRDLAERVEGEVNMRLSQAMCKKPAPAVRSWLLVVVARLIRRYRRTMSWLRRRPGRAA